MFHPPLTAATGTADAEDADVAEDAEDADAAYRLLLRLSRDPVTAEDAEVAEAARRLLYSMGESTPPETRRLAARILALDVGKSIELEVSAQHNLADSFGDGIEEKISNAPYKTATLTRLCDWIYELSAYGSDQLHLKTSNIETVRDQVFGRVQRGYWRAVGQGKEGEEGEAPAAMAAAPQLLTSGFSIEMWTSKDIKVHVESEARLCWVPVDRVEVNNGKRVLFSNFKGESLYIRESTIIRSDYIRATKRPKLNKSANEVRNKTKLKLRFKPPVAIVDLAGPVPTETEAQAQAVPVAPPIGGDRAAAADAGQQQASAKELVDAQATRPVDCLKRSIPLGLNLSRPIDHDLFIKVSPLVNVDTSTFARETLKKVCTLRVGETMRCSISVLANSAKPFELDGHNTPSASEQEQILNADFKPAVLWVRISRTDSVLFVW